MGKWHGIGLSPNKTNLLRRIKTINPNKASGLDITALQDLHLIGEASAGGLFAVFRLHCSILMESIQNAHYSQEGKQNRQRNNRGQKLLGRLQASVHFTPNLIFLTIG